VNVVYVSTIPSGGPVSHLRTLVPRVAAAGVGVSVVCATEEVATEFWQRGVSATVVPVRHKLDLWGTARLWPLLKSADVVHTHDRRAGLLARPQARLRGAGIVHTLHGLPEEIATAVGRLAAPPLAGASPGRVFWLRRGYLPIESALSSMGMVISPSRALRRFLIHHGFSEERIRVIPSAVEIRRRHPPAPRTPVTVGTIAGLEYWKGVDLLVEACGQVSAPIRLEVYGEGVWRRRLEARARALGIDARFHGRVPAAEERLEEMDLFVLPSRADNLPMVILEAMARALPVVATRVGGVSEVVEDGRTGVLIEPEDVSALAAAIEALASDPTRREAMGSAGAQRASQLFDPNEIAARLVDLYAEVRARGKRARRAARRPPRFAPGSGHRYA
jgi:glycosyltransferase involved in cell wall biosynthesis